MEIMSLNAWGGKLHGQLLSYLIAAEADVICLHEITHSREAEAEWLTATDLAALRALISRLIFH